MPKKEMTKVKILKHSNTDELECMVEEFIASENVTNIQYQAVYHEKSVHSIKYSVMMIFTTNKVVNK